MLMKYVIIKFVFIAAIYLQTLVMVFSFAQLIERNYVMQPISNAISIFSDLMNFHRLIEFHEKPFFADPL